MIGDGQLLAFALPQGQGLLQLGFGLFHQKEAVREATVDLLNNLRAYPVCQLVMILGETRLILRTGRDFIPPKPQSFPALCIRPTGARKGEKDATAAT
jgi:hypothetical protein